MSSVKSWFDASSQSVLLSLFQPISMLHVICFFRTSSLRKQRQKEHDSNIFNPKNFIFALHAVVVCNMLNIQQCLPGDSKWPFWKVKWPFKGFLCDLQLEDKQVTLNHLVQEVLKPLLLSLPFFFFKLRWACMKGVVASETTACLRVSRAHAVGKGALLSL